MSFLCFVLGSGWDPTTVSPWYKERLAKKQCVVGKDNNPIFGGKAIGTMTLNECKARCNTDKDSKGRPCVAIEWADGGKALSSTTKKGCALAWGCDSTKGWNGGSVFKRLESAAYTAPGSIDTDPFDIDNLPDAEEPMKGNWTDWYQLHYYDVVIWLLITLVALCAVNLCVTVRQRQQAQYVAVKYFDTESERDVEAMPMVQ